MQRWMAAQFRNLTFPRAVSPVAALVCRKKKATESVGTTIEIDEFGENGHRRGCHNVATTTTYKDSITASSDNNRSDTKLIIVIIEKCNVPFILQI